MPAQASQDRMQHLPYYSLVFIHSAFVTMAIRIIQSENNMNKGDQVAPDAKGWKKDLALRTEYRDLYNSINSHPNLADFDRKDLIDIPNEVSMSRRAVTKGLNHAVLGLNLPTMPNSHPKKRRVGAKSTEAHWNKSYDAAVKAAGDQPEHDQVELGVSRVRQSVEE